MNISEVFTVSSWIHSTASHQCFRFLTEFLRTRIFFRFLLIKCNKWYIFVAIFFLSVFFVQNFVIRFLKSFLHRTWFRFFRRSSILGHELVILFFSQVYNLHFCPIDMGGQPVQSNIVSMAYCFKNNMSHYPHNPNKIVFQWDVEVYHHKMLLKCI